MKTGARLIIAVVLAFAALGAQAGESAGCWEPAEEEIEGLGGEPGRSPFPSRSST
jgi:hypothetical protein